jgi:hypothetical protein
MREKKRKRPKSKNKRRRRKQDSTFSVRRRGATSQKRTIEQEQTEMKMNNKTMQE